MSMMADRIFVIEYVKAVVPYTYDTLMIYKRFRFCSALDVRPKFFAFHAI